MISGLKKSLRLMVCSLAGGAAVLYVFGLRPKEMLVCRDCVLVAGSCPWSYHLLLCDCTGTLDLPPHIIHLNTVLGQPG